MAVNKILKFINKFKELYPTETEVMFTSGLCYWFSYILKIQFNGKQYYDPIEGHFLTKIGNNFYDITGKVKKNKDMISWDKYQKEEPIESKRIIKYCKNLIE